MPAWPRSSNCSTDAETSVKAVSVTGWAFAFSIALVVMAYGFACLKLAGFLGGI